MMLEEILRALSEEQAVAERPLRRRVEQLDQIEPDLWQLHVPRLVDVPIDLAGGSVKGTGWNGHILDTRPADGTLIVDTSGAPGPPQKGPVEIRPFQFLEPLRSIYAAAHNDLQLEPELEKFLLHCEGRHPSAPPPDTPNVPDPIWSHCWAAIWGPPGTGKTHTIASEIPVLAEGDQRILVVSTTNKATDEVARRLAPSLVDDQNAQLVRVGPGADYHTFASLAHVLEGGEVQLRRRIAEMQQKAEDTTSPVERASLLRDIDSLRSQLPNLGFEIFFRRPEKKIVVTTTFKALTILDGAISNGSLNGVAHRRPFDVVVIDEAGMVPRVTVAALSLLARRSTVLVGDPRQLTPVARSKHASHALTRSALEHIGVGTETGTGNVRMLVRQHRMHPRIRSLVSAYSYDGRLEDAPEVNERTVHFDTPIERVVRDTRTVWYVVDVHEPLGQTDSKPGPNNRSRVRPITTEILARIFRFHPNLARGSVDGRQASGLFVSPYVAQAKAVGEWFRGQGHSQWRASTIHRQQGAEADFVIVDTVRAESRAWSPPDWRRLMNVSLSRARHLAIVIASHAEMSQAWMRDLVRPPGDEGAAGLMPYILSPNGRWNLARRFQAAPGRNEVRPTLAPGSLGAELEQQRQGRRLDSAGQRRLFDRPIVGHQMLVRGPAGSGKSLVLARWAARLAREGLCPIWFVYANDALRNLLERLVADQFDILGSPVTLMDRIAFISIRDLLGHYIDVRQFVPFDYEAMAQAALDAPRLEAGLQLPVALVVDEAQDMGEATIRFLASRVAEEGERKTVLLACDEAQNIYGRTPPHWGTTMPGVETEWLEEPFRSTGPILELATNILCRTDEDSRQRMEREGTIERDDANGAWWRVRAPLGQGRDPVAVWLDSDGAQARWVAEKVAWLHREGVQTRDVAILCAGDSFTAKVQSALNERGVRDGPSIFTSHSYKGHEAEVVIVPFLDRLLWDQDDDRLPLNERRSPSELLRVAAHLVYVAATRARSMLMLSGPRTWEPPRSYRGDEERQRDQLIQEAKGRLVEVVKECVETQRVAGPAEWWE